MGYQIPPAKHEDIQALTVLNSILSGGESSRLPQRLVRNDKIALFSAGQPYTRQGPGIFIYFAGFLISNGERSGFAWYINAASPAAPGVAILVPE